MATSRFGGVSPTRYYQTKVKLVLVGAASLVVVLCALLIFIYTKSATPVEGTGPIVGASGAGGGSASGTQILFTGRRIEIGEQLLDGLVIPQPWEGELPEGAVLAGELETVRGLYFKDPVGSKLPLVRSYLSPTKPISPIDIPAGYRAVAIEVDKRSGVQGFIVPNSRVDVLFSYVDPSGQRRLKTLVQFVKVLAVGTMIQASGPVADFGDRTNITLLVTEIDAKKIELARTMGTLSLSLVGGSEQPKTQDDQNAIDTIGPSLIFGDPGIKPQELPSEGTMYMDDPKTGKKVKYELRSGKWSPVEEED